MPRRRRSSLPSPAIYHVTTRGVERRPIVLDAIDADAWEARLLETADRYGWELDTWSLMPNHFHLLVLTWQPLLSDGMRRLNGMYAQRFNRRYGRSGHLFGSRFEAYVIETEEHLDAARLYVYENATRAGLVGWRWRGPKHAVGGTGRLAPAARQLKRFSSPRACWFHGMRWVVPAVRHASR